MKKLLLASLAAGVLAAGAPTPAFANHGIDYIGGCTATNVNQEDTTGQEWVGEVDVVIVASSDEHPTDPNDRKTPQPTWVVTDVECYYTINGGPASDVILVAPDGTGATAAAGEFRYTAEVEDIVAICTRVTITDPGLPRRSQTFDGCVEQTTTEFPPPLVVEAINAVIALVNELGPWTDEWTICGILTTIAPTVNGLNQHDLLYIRETWDRTDPVYPGTPGDTWVLGGFFWDCVPYEPPPPAA